MKALCITIASIFICLLNVLGNQLQFNSLNAEESFVNKTYTTSYIDSYGYLWVGGNNGVDRYDGTTVKNLNALLKDSEKDITCITEDIEGNLIFGTSSGLYIWNSVAPHLVPIHFAENNNNKLNISKIAFAGDHLFYLKANNKLYLFDSKKRELKHIPFNKSDSHPLNFISDFIVYNQIVYAATKGGLIEYSPNNKFRILTNKPSFLSAFCLTHHKNSLYVGSSNRGLWKYNLSDGSISLIESLLDYKVRCLAGLGDQLYVGTMISGLKVLNIKDYSVDTYKHNKNDGTTLLSNSILSIKIDKNKCLWLNTTRGLNYTSLLKQPFISYKPNNNLEFVNRSIRSLYFNSNFKLIGTRDGLYKVDSIGNTQKIDSEKKYLEGQVIINFAEYRNNILVSVLNKGIVSYSPKKQSINLWKDDIFNDQSAYAFDKDSADNLWIGTHNGLYKVDTNEEVIAFKTSNSELKNDCIYAVKIDNKNRIWAGGLQGLYIYENNADSFVCIHQFQLDSNNRALYLYQDSSNSMWVSMEKDGLYQFDMDLNLVKSFSTKNELFQNSVVSILEYRENEFWMGTTNGLGYFNANLDSSFRYYKTPYLLNASCNLGASVLDEEGTLWFGNEKGLISFKADDALKVASDNNVTITNLLVDGIKINSEQLNYSPIEDLQQLNLTEKTNSIEFQFVNLCFPNSNINSYCVKLEGRDTQWQYLSNKNKIVYTSLKPGEYVLNIGLYGSNKRIIENSVRKLPITVKRDWYALLWILLFLMVTVTFLALFIRIKKQKNQIQQNTNIEKKEKYETSNLDIAKSKAIVMNVKIYMEQSKAYLNNNLRLIEVADALNIPSREISQAINENLNIRFTSFVNEYRVNEVKARMAQSKYEKYTIQAIAESCGFKTKTSFNLAFKKACGKTPSEYLAEIETKNNNPT